MSPISRPTREQVSVFRDQAAFRKWLEANHDLAPDLWVGYYRKGLGKTAMTYPQAVEEALCFGWIDGLTYRIDDEVHANRFTPRRQGSSWSAPNIANVAELRQAGRMHPAGIRAFEERDKRKDMPYLRDHPLRQKLPPELEARIRTNPAAWTYWQAQRPSYRKEVAFWILSAKQEPTRERRMASLIEDSAAGRPVKPLSYERSKDR
ncbi:MAG: YdeI/OmpD-associated family protein [Candidatus Limnocylindria bacterium]